MAVEAAPSSHLRPTIMPLGDAALLVRFGNALTDQGNRAALALTRRLELRPIRGVDEVVPNLVSVMVRYDPHIEDPARIAGELRLLINVSAEATQTETRSRRIPVDYNGPDLIEVAGMLGLDPEAFKSAHTADTLRVLATGFAPGFVYCGLHRPTLVVPRRSTVRPVVARGAILFAAGQTAITATEMPTGWHVIGHTTFNNFDPQLNPPTQLVAGDLISFEAVP